MVIVQELERRGGELGDVSEIFKHVGILHMMCGN